MSYPTVDDDAATSISGGAWSSASHLALRAAIVEAYNTRLPGCVTSYTTPVRLCSVLPDTCVGPFVVYLSPAESWGRVAVRLRFDAVEYPNESDGTDAVYVCATCCAEDGWYEYPPSFDPTDTDADGETDSGWTILERGDSDLVTVYAETRGRRGDIGILLWYRSAMRATADETGTIEEGQQQDSWRVSAIGTPSYGTPPERAFLVQADIGTNTLEGRLHQLCAWQDDAPDYYAYVEPLRELVEVASRGFSWETREIGVLPLRTVALESEPPTSISVPSEASLYADEPVAEQWMAMAGAIEVFRRGRVPMLLSSPGEGDDGLLWPIRSDDASFSGPAAVESSAWSALVGALCDEETSGAAGYEALLAVAMYFGIFEPRRSTEYRVRVGCYSPTSATLLGQSVVPHRVDYDDLEVVSLSPVQTFRADYVALAHTVSRTLQFPTWQFRGTLLDRGGWSRVGHDAGILYWFRVALEDAQTADPSRLILEAIAGSDVGASWAVVAAAIRNAPLGDP